MIVKNYRDMIALLKSGNMTWAEYREWMSIYITLCYWNSSRRSIFKQEMRMPI